MNTLAIILIGYIVYSNIMAILFVNLNKKIIYTKWFTVLMFTALPMVSIVLVFQTAMEEKRVKEKSK